MIKQSTVIFRNNMHSDPILATLTRDQFVPPLKHSLVMTHNKSKCFPLLIQTFLSKVRKNFLNPLASGKISLL